MDPHFHEYLAAIAGMHDVYGGRPDEHPTEFHDDHVVVVAEEPAAASA
jgi:hypothetical protein